MPANLPLPFLRFCAVSACALLGLVACSTPESRREEFREKMGPPQPQLEGSSAFFQGKVAVTATLGASIRPPRSEGSGSDHAEGEGGRSRGGPPGGGSGMGMGGGGPRAGGGEGREGIRSTSGRSGGGGGRAGMASPPRQVLTVTLKNLSTVPLTVQVTDVVSILGNFVPIPERATLAPGSSVTLESMRGSLANLDELDLSLALRSEGSAEKQVIALHRSSVPSP